MVRIPNFLRISTKRRKTLIPLLLGLLSTLFFYLTYVSKPPVFEQVSNLILDRYQIWKPRDYQSDVPVRIIDIDNESIKRIGQWPWPRTTLAQLNSRLSEAGAAVIAYDIIFSEEDRTSPDKILPVLKANPRAKGSFKDIENLVNHDDIFANSIANSNVVLGFFLVHEDTERLPETRHGFSYGGTFPSDQIGNFKATFPAIPVLGQAAGGEGFVSFNPEGDGIVREAPLVFRIEERKFPSLSLEALRVVQGAGAIILQSSDGHQQIGSSATPELALIKVGEFEFPTTPSGKFRVYYTKPSPELDKLRYVPAWKILDPNIDAAEWSDKIAGNIVFMGTSADGLKDLVATPLRPVEPGVSVHAQITEQVIGEAIHGHQILKQPYWAPVLELMSIVISGLALSFILPRFGALTGAVFTVIVIAGAAATSWVAFSQYQFVIKAFYPITAIITTYAIMTVTSFYLTESERSRIRNAFSMYLSPTMVKIVSDNPDLLTLGGEERDMTILFLDIRSFSKISESMEPSEITTFLNIFLTPMTDILQKYNATIDKYIGDAIVAFWNAPLDDSDHQGNAARAVLEMESKLSKLNKTYSEQDLIKWPDDVSMGIGLNTGICCVGNLGSEQRFSYSMIGDAANLASRIEGLTKQYKVSVLIGDSTAQALSDFAIIEADLIQVVGRQTPERIWVLLGSQAASNDAVYKSHMKQHTEFLKAYRAQLWDKAHQLITQMKPTAKDLNLTGYYEVMADRINSYKASPPGKDWSGIYVATSK